MRDPHRTAPVRQRRNSPDEESRRDSAADRDLERLGGGGPSSGGDMRGGSFKLLMPSPRPGHRALSPSPRSKDDQS